MLKMASDMALVGLILWSAHLLRPFIIKVIPEFAPEMIRRNLDPPAPLPLPDFTEYLGVSAVIVLGSVCILELLGFYRESTTRSIRQLLETTLWLALCVVASIILLKFPSPPWYSLIMAAAVACPLLFLKKVLWDKLVRRAEAQHLRSQ